MFFLIEKIGNEQLFFRGVKARPEALHAKRAD